MIEQAIALTDETCVYILAVIADDLGLLRSFPEFGGQVKPFFTKTPLADLAIQGLDFLMLFERLVGLNKDADTYFVCLAALHKGRLKYGTILRTQPMPTVEQIGPRGLLQFGSPIIASAIGGTPAPANRSPVRRHRDRTKRRQIDCIREKRAYELKLRVTIAASGQGRWREELDFPVDCRRSGFTPVLVVFDSTPNEKLAQLEKAFKNQKGEVYIGETAWKHLDDLAGATMAKFLDKYVREPLDQLLREVPIQLPRLTAEVHAEHIKICVGEESITIRRTPDAEAALENDEMPEDDPDQLPEA